MPSSRRERESLSRIELEPIAEDSELVRLFRAEPQPPATLWRPRSSAGPSCPRTATDVLHTSGAERETARTGAARRVEEPQGLMAALDDVRAGDPCAAHPDEAKA